MVHNGTLKYIMVLYVTLIRSFTKLNSNMVLEGSSVLTNLALWICRHTY